MSRLLNQLLSDASVIHRSNLQRFAPVDMVEIVHQALHEALPQALPAPRVQLAVGVASSRVQGDALLLREAIKNLIDNALKYGGDGPLQVALTEEGAWSVVTIADHGPGVPAQRRDEMFVAFQRLGDTDNTTGLGLGLALSKGFVEGMGGTLTPEDTPGGGLTMTISLPREPDEPRSEDEDRGRDIPGGDGSGADAPEPDTSRPDTSGLEPARRRDHGRDHSHRR